jgi:hypothetical protein
MKGDYNMNQKKYPSAQSLFEVKRRLKIFYLLLLSLAACQTVETPPQGKQTQRIAMVSHLDSAYAISASKNTISWKPDSSFILANERIDADSYKRLLEDAIVVTLRNKGYTLSNDPAQAALLVSYAAGLETELSDREITRRFGMIPGLQGVTQDEDKYEKGTIIVDVFDKSANKSIWRGVVQGFADLELSPAERSQRLKQIMQQLMSEFPGML